MSWVVFAGLVALTLVVLYLPGTVVALAGRLPLTASLAAAPAISVAVVSLVAIVADAVSLPLGPLPVVGGTLLVAGGMLAICSASRRLSLPRVASRGESGASAVRPPVARIWWLLTALGASALMGRRIVSVLRSPESFTQTLDGIYHLNAVRWIIDHTNGSALTMAMTAGDRPPSFYPLGWHDMISVTLLSAGSRDVIAGTNAMIMAVAAVVWTGGCLYLVLVCVSSLAVVSRRWGRRGRGRRRCRGLLRGCRRVCRWGARSLGSHRGRPARSRIPSGRRSRCSVAGRA